MPRVTRAQAAAVADQVHIDEDALLEFANSTQLIDQPEPEHRLPLSEIEPNSGTSSQDGELSESQSDNHKPEGGKSKKGGRKATKKSSPKITNALASSTATPPQEEPVEVMPDKQESAPSPASRPASDDLMKDQPDLDIEHSTLQDIRPKTPQSSAVRLTRSQLRKVPSVEEPVEPKSIRAETKNKPSPAAATNVDTDGGVQIPAEAESTSGTEPRQFAETEDLVLPAPEDMPNTLQYLREVSTPTKTSENTVFVNTAEKMRSSTSYDDLEAAAVEAQTPPRIDPIAALDALDDALEKVNAEVPDVQPSPQKKSKKPVPIVRTTKASMARVSLAHGLKDAARVPSLGKPRPSTAFGDSTARRVTSVSSNKSDEYATEKKEVVIPHSKSRPISMSFPAPKPPPKSTKAPTKSTFQLPGEAVAAKLKAAREARIQKEAEDNGKKTFKARPAPAMTKAPAVRQTSTSKARESMIGGKPPVTSTLHKRANSVATTKPSTKTLTTIRPTPSTANRKSIVPSSSSTVQVSKRPSTAMAPRPSTATATSRPPRPVSVISGGIVGTKTAKGKEVFNRAATAKSAAEKEKREKEEAAKKARAAAAERGRQASREWAEKQRLKKLGAKTTMTEVEPVPTADVTEIVTPELAAVEA